MAVNAFQRPPCQTSRLAALAMSKAAEEKKKEKERKKALMDSVKGEPAKPPTADKPNKK